MAPLSSTMSCLPSFKIFSRSKPADSPESGAGHNARVMGQLPHSLHLPIQIEYEGDSAPPSVRARLARHSQDGHGSERRGPAQARMRPARAYFLSTMASIQSTSTPTSSLPSSPVRSRRGRRESWATSSMSPETLAALFGAIHETLEHVPYAICGLGALVDSGFSERHVSQLSILCPAYAKDNVRAWLATRGYDTTSQGDSVGININLPGGAHEVRRVRIKYLDEGFDRLERVRSRCAGGNAWVLGLASQLDHAATGFVDHHKRLRKALLRRQEHLDADGTTTEEDEASIRAAERALRSIARDIFFLLDRATREHWVLDPELLPTLLGEPFWEPFTARNHQARTEMARAGIDVAAVLSRHRVLAAVREHEEMVRQFVDDDDCVVDADAQAGGPFEGMHVLGADDKGKGKGKETETDTDVANVASKSVYSVTSTSVAFAPTVISEETGYLYNDTPVGWAPSYARPNGW
ncbi:hypothetical protein GGR52DRAFT_592478 [Hypoxylon sp. FL1284]|nr:hypothetical protein GGR52DRAFT_592478 [Hypoxylon sp. FL1284]